MDLQQLSDRAEIQELLTRYCHAIDENDWPTLDNIFTDDTECDYSQFGGPRCDKKGLIEFLSGFVGSIAGSQHTISTMTIDLAADTAKVRTAAQVMLIMPDENGVNQINVSGLWYHDTVVKTTQGWRIKQRTLKYAWASGLPLKMY
jgi:hypothetical protein